MSDTVKRLAIKDFRELGFLQEVNRLFLHPRGLALEIVQEADGTESLGGIWDYREDAEGISFAALADDAAGKAARVSAELERHRAAREAMFGGALIQPLAAEPGAPSTVRDVLREHAPELAQRAEDIAAEPGA